MTTVWETDLLKETWKKGVGVGKQREGILEGQEGMARQVGGAQGMNGIGNCWLVEAEYLPVLQKSRQRWAVGVE